MAKDERISRRTALKAAAAVAAPALAPIPGALAAYPHDPDHSWYIDDYKVGIFFTIKNDRMEPTLRPGDVALVDTDVTKFSGDDIYLYEMPYGGLQIYRVSQAPGGTLSFISDNPAYASQDGLPRNTPFVGRAVGYMLSHIPPRARR